MAKNWVDAFLFQAQMGWTQHDYGHQSVFASSRNNHLAQYFLMCFCKVVIIKLFLPTAYCGEDWKVMSSQACVILFTGREEWWPVQRVVGGGGGVVAYSEKVSIFQGGFSHF